MNTKTLLLILFIGITSFRLQAQEHSVAREWNEVLLTAIRNDFARPTVHARNLWHTSIAMYDAWAVYDTIATPFFLGQTVGTYTNTFDIENMPIPADIEAAREEAMSFAMYRIIRHRFQNSPGSFIIISAANNLMNQLGYDPNSISFDYTSGSPAALGNYIGLEIINFGLQDSANEQGGYGNLNYVPVNDPLVMAFPGNPDIIDINHWQPLTLNVFIDQSGNIIPFNTPPFLSPEWGSVTNFALSDEDLTIYNRDNFDYHVYHDPGMPPLLSTDNPKALSEDYKWGFSLVSIWSSMLDPSDGVMWDISPASIGNIQSYPDEVSDYPEFYNLLEGGDASIGHTVNPVTGEPYEPQIVPRADYARVLAEFWADGPDSETPPGHWFTLLNYVSDHPLLEKRFGGEREILDNLEWDVKSYFLMGSAMHDAAVCTWGIKGWYDYIRPVSAIRAMAELGQSTDPNLPNYHIGGLPLIPGFIEVVQAGDPLEGSVGQDVGEIKIYAWRGPDYINNSATDVAGVDWILAKDWWPYQRPSFVTPNFAGYISGHSTYSSTAADIMTYLTGDAFFPGGMGIFDAEQNEFLVFEDGPSETIFLQWATYRDASDQCSLSRIWGGIHPPADDIPGRKIGREIANDVFSKAQDYFFRDADNDGFYYFEDCNDSDPSINPMASEMCDGIDNNCSGIADDGLVTFTYYQDADSDGYGDAGISIDTCALTAPMGYVSDNTDCNDNDANINPAAAEICDAIDNDCNGMINDGLDYFTYYRDMDNDSYGDAGVPLDTCLLTPPSGYVTNDTDCNDTDDTINPAAIEVCDAIDNDCNGMVNDGLETTTYYLDNDQDTYGDTGVSIDTCLATPPAGYVAISGDCNDADEFINPAVAEACDAIDNDCNGFTDDGLEVFRYYQDTDADSFGDAAIFVDTCIAIPPTGFVLNDLDCDDTNGNIHPVAEDIADNGIDEDCTGFDLFKQTKVFPNPTLDGKLTVHYDFKGEVLVQVFTIDGRKVRDEFVYFENNFTNYEIGDLAKGVYILRFFGMDDENYFVEKVRLD